MKQNCRACLKLLFTLFFNIDEKGFIDNVVISYTSILISQFSKEFSLITDLKHFHLITFFKNSNTFRHLYLYTPKLKFISILKSIKET